MLKDLLANLLMAATDLHVSGAIRPEHAERFSAFRTALEQAHDQAEAPAALPSPDAQAFEALRAEVAAIGDKVSALHEAAGV